MHRHLRIVVLAALILAPLAATSARAAPAAPAEGRYIVKFRDGQAGRAAVSQAGGRVMLDLPDAAAVRLPCFSASANPAERESESDERPEPCRYEVGTIDFPPTRSRRRRMTARLGGGEGRGLRICGR